MHVLRLFVGWLVSDKSLAPATWGLVVVTALLVIDGWIKSREQRERWKLEDERWKKESEPSAVIELGKASEDSNEMVFACFNLGTTSFYLHWMTVTAQDGTREEIRLPPHIVLPGKSAKVGYDPSKLLGMFGENSQFKEANAVFVVRGATGMAKTEPVWFYLSYGPKGFGCEWREGRLADRQPGTVVYPARVMP